MTLALVEKLRATGKWKEARTSPVPRTKETAVILAQALDIPVETDERVSMEGNFVDLLPPTEPNGIIFISHLPVLTQILRVWSKLFHLEEPPLTEEASGYLVDPESKTIIPVRP